MSSKYLSWFLYALFPFTSYMNDSWDYQMQQIVVWNIVIQEVLIIQALEKDLLIRLHLCVSVCTSVKKNIDTFFSLLFEIKNFIRIQSIDFFFPIILLFEMKKIQFFLI